MKELHKASPSLCPYFHQPWSLLTLWLHSVGGSNWIHSVNTVVTQCWWSHRGKPGPSFPKGNNRRQTLDSDTFPFEISHRTGEISHIICLCFGLGVVRFGIVTVPMPQDSWDMMRYNSLVLASSLSSVSSYYQATYLWHLKVLSQWPHESLTIFPQSTGSICYYSKSSDGGGISDRPTNTQNLNPWMPG